MCVCVCVCVCVCGGGGGGGGVGLSSLSIIDRRSFRNFKLEFEVYRGDGSQSFRLQK